MEKHVSRNLPIEVLRIVAMILIVACHFIIHFDWNSHHFAYVLDPAPGWSNALKHVIVQYGQVGVSIFFIISGYFLVNKDFRWSRILKTWFQMFCYSLGALCAVLCVTLLFPSRSFVAHLFSGEERLRTLEATFLPFLYNSYWFIGAYLLLLLASPFLNKLCAALDWKNHVLLIVFISFLSMQSLLLGRTSNWNNLTYAILGYLIGAWLKNYYRDFAHLFRMQWMIPVALLLTGMMLVFNYVASSGSAFVRHMTWDGQVHNGIILIPVVIGAFCFIWSLQIDLSWLPEWVKKVIVAVAPTTFGIYLIHENLFGFRIVWELVSRLAIKPEGLLLQACASVGLVLATFVCLSVLAWCYNTVIVRPLEKILFRSRSAQK